MNSTTIAAPEVQQFLTEVRAQLADLDPDEQREILDGLEADLTDLVAEHGGEALGDPVAYARELRAAAGLEPDVEGETVRHTPPAVVTAFLDGCREQFDRLVAGAPRAIGDLLSWSRPLWWVLRGWLAVELLDLFHRGDPYTAHLRAIPDLSGFGWLLVVVAVALSVQIGRGRIWPGDGSRGVVARLVLLALNLLAIGYAPFVAQLVVDGVHQRYDRQFELGYQNGARDIRDSSPSTDKAGLYADGKWVSNIYPYDAKGRPLVGVQLFNQIGQPINVITQAEYPQEECSGDTGECAFPAGTPLDANGNPVPRIYYPWTNGASQLLNVFPIPSRLQADEQPDPTAFTGKVKPTVGPFPAASVTKVSLPGIKPGLLSSDR